MLIGVTSAHLLSGHATVCVVSKRLCIAIERRSAGSFQINLKYRSSDRYISAAQDLSGSQKGKVKFEEDILPPFVRKFSHSNSVETDVMPHFETIKDVAALFPGIAHLGIDENTPVQTAK